MKMTIKCMPCKNKWAKRFYKCWCMFEWQAPEYRIVLSDVEISIDDLC